MKRINPVRFTVKHYMEAGELRTLRRLSRERLGNKHKQQKSNFVRFMESLQNRGPHTLRGELYKKWTKTVRHQMEEAGTWPKPTEETNLKIIAEYLSRLQAVFWEEFPEDKWYAVREDHSEMDEKFLPYRRILKRIFMKLRRKGMRDRTFTMCDWKVESVWWTWVQEYSGRANSEEYNIYPYAPFNNHGADI